MKQLLRAKTLLILSLGITGCLKETTYTPHILLQNYTPTKSKVSFQTNAESKNIEFSIRHGSAEILVKTNISGKTNEDIKFQFHETALENWEKCLEEEINNQQD